MPIGVAQAPGGFGETGRHFRHQLCTGMGHADEKRRGAGNEIISDHAHAISVPCAFSEMTISRALGLVTENVIISLVLLSSRNVWPSRSS